MGAAKKLRRKIHILEPSLPDVVVVVDAVVVVVVAKNNQVLLFMRYNTNLLKKFITTNYLSISANMRIHKFHYWPNNALLVEKRKKCKASDVTSGCNRES